MLNIKNRTEMSKEEADAHFDKHCKEIEEYKYEFTENDADFMFDGLSFSTWKSVFDMFKLPTAKITRPLAIDLLADKEGFSNISKSIKKEMQALNENCFVRSDVLIDAKTNRDISKDYRVMYKGMKRSWKTLSFDRIRITEEMTTQQFRSPIPRWIFYVQEIPYYTEYMYDLFIDVAVYDGKINQISRKHDEIEQVVNELVSNLKEKNIRPRHPQMSEGNIPEFSFALRFVAPRNDVYGKAKLFDASATLTENDVMERRFDRIIA